MVKSDVGLGRHRPSEPRMCAKVVHRNTIEFRQKCHHAPVDERADDLLGKLRVRSRQRRCLGLRHHGGAHDVAGGEAAALAGEFVATARSAHSFEDSCRTSA